MWKWVNSVYCNILRKLSKELGHDQEFFRQRVVIESLNTDLFRKYDVNKASITNVSVIYSDILTYNKNINFCIEHLKNRVSISNNWCSYSFQEVELMVFLMDKGRFINVELSVCVFKEKLLIFHDLVTKLRQSEDLTDEHNLRMVRRFHNHCVDIVETFNDFLNS